MCLKCLFHHFLSRIVYTFRENREFVFTIIIQFMMSANSQIRFGFQILFVCLYITTSHYHHYANLSEDIELIKCLSDILVACVRLSISFQLSIIQYVWLRVFSLHILLWWLRKYIYTLSYHHHQIGSMNYYPLFRVRSWNNGMRCMSFDILVILSRQWNYLCRQVNIFIPKRVSIIRLDKLIIRKLHIK